MSNLTYDLKIRDQAALEFKEAYVWYEEQKAGLGEEFGVAINGTIAKILNHPYHYKKSYKNYHEVVVNRFPFLIVYAVKEQEMEIIIIAIFHTSRNPKGKYRR